MLGGTLADLTQRLGKEPLAYEPGTQWIYSVSHDVQARLLVPTGALDARGAAGTHFFVDRSEQLVAVFLIQKMGGSDGPGVAAQFETLVYPAIVD